MSDTIKVKVNWKKPQTLIWEHDKSHPGGEICIDATDNEKTVEVGETPAIRKRIGLGHLEKVDGKKAPKGDKSSTE